MIIFLLFFGISLFTLIIAIIFYLDKESSYTRKRNQILILGSLTTDLIFLVVNLPFFLRNEVKLFLDANFNVVIPTMLFNLSCFFVCISIIMILLDIFQLERSIIVLEKPSRIASKKGDIPIGRVLKGRLKKQKFSLSLKDLEKHMFICGATGTGKSNFLQNFLINFAKHHPIPFLLVEFKGEYHFLQKKIEDVLIFWPGENFSINIFNPEKTSPIIHAERIFDILKSGKFLDENSEFTPQMEKVLVEILTKVCQIKKYQNWKGFEYFCEEYLKKNENNIPMLNQTLISIKNRIRRFSKGPLRALFEENTKIDISELFTRKIILDLSSIIRLGGEKEDALFFLNMILKYLWDKNLMSGAHDFKGIKHLTVIEDAQYFAPQDLMKKSKITTYLEDIALLQRGTGECLITLATRPAISREILANNGIVLTFKNHLEKEIMCDLLNLDFEKKNYLSVLEEGQCIIRINSIKEPFLLEVPYIRQESLNFSEIYENNKEALKTTKPGDKSPKNNSKNNRFCRYIKVASRIKCLLSLFKKKRIEKSSNNQTTTNNILDLEKELVVNNLGNKAFGELENFINELYKIQNEKE
ncbi:MAG: ATP-binding protein [Candidatus Heimdallarchaeota archaeon]